MVVPIFLDSCDGRAREQDREWEVRVQTAALLELLEKSEEECYTSHAPFSSHSLACLPEISHLQAAALELRNWTSCRCVQYSTAVALISRVTLDCNAMHSTCRVFEPGNFGEPLYHTPTEKRASRRRIWPKLLPSVSLYVAHRSMNTAEVLSSSHTIKDNRKVVSSS